MPVYTGRERQYTAASLAPKSSYAFRVSASNAEGKSQASGVSSFLTKPGAPAAPSVPRVVGRPTTDSFEVAWDTKETNEGEADKDELQYIVEVDNGRRADAVR